ncbi:GAF domain-containing protein [Streptomyces kronopolitis]
MNVRLADGHGAVLQRRFGEASLVRRLAAIQSVPGFVFAEQFAGTNGIGLALAERQLINVYGAEHFAERSQANACAAIPVRDPLSGRIEGVLCFGYPPADADAGLNTVISRAAGAIEQRLLTQSSLRERALLQAYLDARGRAAAGEATGNGEPAGTGLDWRDELMLKERAADLIASGQRAAVEVTLPGGRRRAERRRGRPPLPAGRVRGRDQTRPRQRPGHPGRRRDPRRRPGRHRSARRPVRGHPAVQRRHAAAGRRHGRIRRAP